MFGLSIPAPITSYIVGALGAAILATGLFAGVQTYRMHVAHIETASALKDIEILKGGAIIAIQRAKADKLRIETEQDKVNAHVEAMRADYDAVRAKYDRLRAARANQGSAGKADMPGVPESPRLAYDPTVSDGLLDTLEAAERQTRQLIGWQAWYKEQSGVDRGVQ